MFFSTSPLPFCRQLINNKQLGDIEMAIGGMGRMIKDAAKTKFKDRADYTTRKRKPPKKFDAMTEGRKVSQAKKMLKNKKSKEAAFAEIGRIMKEAGIGQKQRPTSKTGSNRIIKRGKKMGGGKIYASTDKKYGGGIFPRKGKM
jgi:hypothetical protein